MQLVKSIISKKINQFSCGLGFLTLLLLVPSHTVLAQDNSPYSRYGIGDLISSTNINNRSMGGITAGYTDQFAINFSNPASFSSFQAWKEKKSKKLSSGRSILDMGVNIDNRTLRDPVTNNSFTASNAIFSYVQVGVPLRRNWGMSFGLRPVSRISYKVNRNERLKDPITGSLIDSAVTRYQGDGGSYLASLGTGVALFSKEKQNGLQEKLSIGVNAGYYFGKKDYSTKLSLINDTVSYYQANYQTKTTFGNLFVSAGIQYQVPIGKKVIITLGAYGQLGQTINARQDILRETFYYDQSLGDVRLDSISDKRDVKGELKLPGSFTAGVVVQKFAIPNKEGGWMIGVDFSQQAWSEYRFYDRADSLRNTWEMRMGAQLTPVPGRKYFTNVNYRFGFFVGPDYVRLQGNTIPRIGASFGAGLPITISRQAPNQVTFVNLAFEYIKRGNKESVLQENQFRISLGFSLSDIWFIKRQYD